MKTIEQYIQENPRFRRLVYQPKSTIHTYVVRFHGVPAIVNGRNTFTKSLTGYGKAPIEAFEDVLKKVAEEKPL